MNDLARTPRWLAASRRNVVARLVACVAAGATALTSRKTLAETTGNPSAASPRPVTAVAVARAKPGQEDELGRRMMALVAPTLAEPGCINYDLHRSNTDPAVWLFYENWRAQADLDAHMQSPHFRAFFAGAREVMAAVDAYQMSMVLPAGQPPRRC